MGGTGIVELMPNGVVIKRASTVIGLLEDNEVELFKEAAIYARLGPHPRLPKIYAYDENSAQLAMEHMCNGDLDRYLVAHNAKISSEQRLLWTIHLLEALCYIHKFGILHADLTPRNLLLDGRLELKVSDFAGSAIDGCIPTGLAGTRYTAPLCTRTNFNLQDEIHILGSTIYHISTGHAPYEEFDIDQVRAFYSQGVYPDTSSLLLDKIIRQCWSGDFKTAEEVSIAVKTLLGDEAIPLHKAALDRIQISQIACIDYCVRGDVPNA